MNRKVLVVSLPAVLLFVLAGCTGQQKVVSVELPATDSSSPVADADNRHSLVVTITRDSQVFLGADATSLDVLAAKVKDRLAASAPMKAYINADTKAPYGAVIGVIDDFRAAGIADFGLLARPHYSERISGDTTATRPVGLPVAAAERPAQGSRTIIVQASKGLGRTPVLKINQEDVTQENLQGRLSDIFRVRAEKVMFVKADEELSFGDVAQVIDMGLSAGATVVVVTAKTESGNGRPGAGATAGSAASGGVLEGVLGGAPITAPKIALPQRVRVSQGVMQALLLSKVEPNYPPLARRAHIQGAVILQATIRKDGTIKDLRAVTGHPMLTPAAVDAVRHWRYKPYYLNGEPVEVETQITVNF